MSALSPTPSVSPPIIRHSGSSGLSGRARALDLHRVMAAGPAASTWPCGQDDVLLHALRRANLIHTSHAGDRASELLPANEMGTICEDYYPTMATNAVHAAVHAAHVHQQCP